MKLKLMIMTALTAVMLSATSASAVTVTINALDQAALTSLNPTQSLNLSGGLFDPSRGTAVGSSGGIFRSPWEGDPDFATTRYYTSGPSGALNLPNPAVLKFNNAQNSLTFLWGSVDTYNILQFRDSGGSTFDTVIGQDLLTLGATPGIQGGAALVTITGLSEAFFQVGFFSNGSNAFEFSNIIAGPGLNVSQVPLPAALPLYGTGLAIMGFIGWRRKRRTSV